MKLGYYSKMAASCYGSVFWKTPNGEEVEITGVKDDVLSSLNYLWPDAVCVGEVTEWSHGLMKLPNYGEWRDDWSHLVKCNRIER